MSIHSQAEILQLRTISDAPSQPPMAVLSEFALTLIKLILELSDLLLARIRAIAHLRTLQACKPLLDCPHIT